MYPCTLLGEKLLLLPEKGIYWPARQTLIVADIHWGKAYSFRKNYIHLPQGTTSADLAKLSDMLDKTNASRLLFLGDLFHSKSGKDGKTLKLIEGWRYIHRHVHMTLVRGNHDLHAGDPPESLNITCLDEPFILAPFQFSHHPSNNEKVYNLCGHIHPSVKLEGNAKQTLHLPCFYFGKAGGILPSFGTFTGNGSIVPKAGEQVFVIADNRIIDLSIGIS